MLQKNTQFIYVSPRNTKAAMSGTWDGLYQGLADRLNGDGRLRDVQVSGNGGGFFSVTELVDNINMTVRGITNGDFGQPEDARNLITGAAYALGIVPDASLLQFSAVGTPGGATTTSPPVDPNRKADTTGLPSTETMVLLAVAGVVLFVLWER